MIGFLTKSDLVSEINPENLNIMKNYRNNLVTEFCEIDTQVDRSTKNEIQNKIFQEIQKVTYFLKQNGHE